MQTNFLPWVKPTTGWFMGLIFVFFLLGLGIHRLQSILSHRGDVLLAIVKKYGLAFAAVFDPVVLWSRKPERDDIECGLRDESRGEAHEKDALLVNEEA